jgi:bifunctional non-homologous end joining protein LigD
MLYEFLQPQLCKSAKLEDIEPRNKVVEFKVDGERSIFFIDFEKNYLRIQNRYIFDKTYVYPEFGLNFLAGVLKCKSVILDGEIVGRSFNEVAMRTHLTDKFKICFLSKNMPLKFLAFDILYLDGESLVDLKLKDRKEILRRVIAENGLVRIIESFETEDVKRIFKTALDGGYEGIVVKDLNGKYEFDKRNWLKVKKKETETVKVLGWNEKSGRGSYGSLKTEMGDVGLLSFANLQEFLDLVKSAGLERIWVEVEYQEKTTSGKLRFPIFKRFIVR